MTLAQLACTETQTVTLDAIGDPITGATTISATSSGTTIEVSDDGSTWHTSPWSYTPPVNSTGSVTFYARAQGDCGTISANPVTVSYDTICTDPTPSTITIPSGQTAFGDGYDASSLVTTTGDPKANLALEYQVTQQQSTPGSAIDVGAAFSSTVRDPTAYPNETDIDNSTPANATGTIDTIQVYLTQATNGSTLKFFTATISGTTVTPKNSVTVTVNGGTAGPFTFSGLSLPVNAGEYIGVWTGTGNSVDQGGTGSLLYVSGDQTGGTYTGQAWAGMLNIHASGTAASVTTEVACTNWTTNAAIPTTTAGGSLCGNYTDGGTYSLYVRGTDPPCGTPIVSAPVSQSFTWNSCTESRTLALDALTNPITGSVNVTATQTGGVPDVLVGDTNPPTQASGWTYTPPLDTTGSVTFYAQGTGTCATLTDSATYSYNTVVAPTISAFSVPANVSGTLNVPITTFTASDNVGVTGYQITTSATAPSAGAGGWSATAPTTYTVGAYGSYTLYAWAKDAAGNVSASSSATVTVSACNDTTPSTISIATGQSVSGSAVDLTTLYTLTGNAGSFVYLINGTPVTSPWDSSAYGATGPQLVTLTVSATDPDCGDAVGPVSELITVNNANPTDVSGVTASSSDSAIKVQAAYSGDVNGDNTLLVEWEECTGGAGSCDGTTFTNSSGVIAHAATPYLYDITGLTNFKVYQVRVTFSDADGVTGTNPTVLLDVIPSNPLLHNAASTGSSKWGGTWGLPGGKYGEFTCATCHTETTTNIKRIKTSIAFPDGSTMPNGAVNSTVALSDTRDGTSDYGDANGGHATSNAVCEVCHSLDETQANGVQHHAYTMSGASAANQDHFLQTDCMQCHNHKSGFLPTSCDACHGNPPTTADTDGSTNTGLVHTDLTGSTTPGAHDTHVNTLGYSDCNTCHSGYVMPNGGDIDIHFNAYGSTSGTYTGQATASYNGVAGSGGLNCNTVYCHGGTIDGTAPAWDGSVACGDCHGASTSNAPGSVASGSDASHATHIGTVGLDCSACHGSGYGQDDGTGTTGTTPADHMAGTVQINLGSYGSYSKGTDFATIGLPSATAYGTCSVSCHGSGTPQWGTSNPTGCTWCHNNGTDDGQLQNAVPAASAAIHATHVVNAPTSYVDDCASCHGAGANTGTHANHTSDGSLGDGAATYGGSLTGYSTANKNCTNSCHSATASNLWTATGALACTDCHSTGYIADTAGAMPTSGLHQATLSTPHNQSLGSNGCKECHVTPAATHIDGTFNANSSSNTDRFITRANLTFTDAAANSATCSGSGLTGCHSDGGAWSRLWSTDANSTATAVGNARCNVCHGQWSSITGSAGWRTGTTHSANATRGQSMHENTPADCDTCHAYGTVSGHHNTATHTITMNGNGTSYERVGSDAGCAGCHGGAADATHNFPQSVFASEQVTGGTVSAPCTGCHASGKSGAIVTSSSPHVIRGNRTGYNTFNACEDCHPGGKDASNNPIGAIHNKNGDANVVEIPNNTTVGINYTTAANASYAASYYQGIVLGGSATTGTTEAEICWNCHNNTTYQQTVISEWGTNTNANTGNMSYNYGTLNQTSWVNATWTSGTAKFNYKTGTIQSTHSVNSSVTGPGADTVGDIRCSYCHDVHNTAGTKGVTGDVDGMPFLRGTWMGNPYREDGAPQSGDSWTTNGSFGSVPRGGTQSTELGGYQIDQNNSNPTSGWTLSSSAGLCTLCHGTDVDNMNQFGTPSTDWVGTNGHSNAVIGGSGSNAANIFSINDRNSSPPTFINNDSDANSSGGNPAMAYQQVSVGSTGNRGFGFRSSSSEPDGWNLAPRTTGTRAHDAYNWGADTNNALDSQYHQFSCSKCHNPHASRLPRLMITNCLDTRHNTWDDQTSVDTIPSAGTQNNDRSSTVSTDNGNVTFSQATSAQNCHRVKDPAFSNSRGSGWNNVTPW